MSGEGWLRLCVVERVLQWPQPNDIIVTRLHFLLKWCKLLFTPNYITKNIMSFQIFIINWKISRPKLNWFVLVFTGLLNYIVCWLIYEITCLNYTSFVISQMRVLLCDKLMMEQVTNNWFRTKWSSSVSCHKNIGLFVINLYLTYFLHLALQHKSERQ